VVYNERVSHMLKYDTRETRSYVPLVHVRIPNSSAISSTPSGTRGTVPSRLLLGGIFVSIAVNVSDGPISGAMRRIATCCCQLVVVGPGSTVLMYSSCLALRCYWCYTGLGVIVAPDCGWPWGIGGADEQVMTVR
jgi:hypothetical protein